jgi:hypothetical protein
MQQQHGLRWQHARHAAGTADAARLAGIVRHPYAARPRHRPAHLHHGVHLGAPCLVHFLGRPRAPQAADTAGQFRQMLHQPADAHHLLPAGAGQQATQHVPAVVLAEVAGIAEHFDQFVDFAAAFRPIGAESCQRALGRRFRRRAAVDVVDDQVEVEEQRAQQDFDQFVAPIAIAGQFQFRQHVGDALRQRRGRPAPGDGQPAREQGRTQLRETGQTRLQLPL